jgi:hypothetical protein
MIGVKTLDDPPFVSITVDGVAKTIEAGEYKGKIVPAVTKSCMELKTRLIYFSDLLINITGG